MSKVVLLAINAKYVHSSLAVWVLAGGISKHARLPHDVHVVESTINRRATEIADVVAAYSPDVIGVSTYIWNAGVLPVILALLREKLPEAVIVLGGPEASFNAAYWLSCGADHVLQGEGEISFARFLDTLAIQGTQGDGTQGDGSVVFAREHNRTVPLCSVPLCCSLCSPCTDEYIAALDGRIAYLETSRGCPFHCAFCLSAGSGVRFLDVETAKEWLRKLSVSGARTIKMVDRTFNCDAKRAYELFEYVIGLETNSRFHFEVAADLFDERTLKLLGTAPPGRIQLEAGLQSFFLPALEASYRKTDLERSELCIKTLHDGRNIHLHVDLIAGLPYETLHDFKNSFDRAYSLGAHTLQLGFLKLLHGSALREKAASLGIIYSSDAPYEIQSSPWLSAGDIQILKHTENSLQHTYNKGRFLSVLEYVLSVSNLRPFSLFFKLGEEAPNHGIDLAAYARLVFDICALLPGVDEKELRDKMVRDWLGMVKGKNMPDFMRNPDDRKGRALKLAQRRLGHGLRREEAAILLSGKAVFVDSNDRDPVTGSYRIYEVEIRE